MFNVIVFSAQTYIKSDLEQRRSSECVQVWRDQKIFKKNTQIRHMKCTKAKQSYD